MQIENVLIEEHNDRLISKHRADLNHLASDIQNIDFILDKLRAFQIAIPSWALGTATSRPSSGLEQAGLSEMWGGFAKGCRPGCRVFVEWIIHECCLA